MEAPGTVLFALTFCLQMYNYAEVMVMGRQARVVNPTGRRYLHPAFPGFITRVV